MTKILQRNKFRGMITKKRYHVTKKGKNAGSKMAVFILEDLQGEAECQPQDGEPYPQDQVQEKRAWF